MMLWEDSSCFSLFLQENQRSVEKVVYKCKPDNTFKENIIAILTLTWQEFNNISICGGPAVLYFYLTFIGLLKYARHSMTI